jgi:hypothetical protein
LWVAAVVVFFVRLWFGLVDLAKGRAVATVQATGWLASGQPYDTEEKYNVFHVGFVVDGGGGVFRRPMV